MAVTHAFGDVHVVDPGLLGTPGALSLYVVDAPEPALVDAATPNTVGAVLDALDEVDVDPADVANVLVSHVHLDHAGGAGHLADELPNATFHVHEAGIDYLTDAERLAALRRSVDRATGVEDVYGDPDVLPAERCRPVGGGETVDLGDRELELVDAPGHAPHHYAAYDPSTGGLFAIDAAGMSLGGAQRPSTPPPGFDLEANLATVDRLRDLEPDRILYGHFGPGSADAPGELERYAELLVEWVDLVADLRDEADGVGDIVDRLGDRWLSPTVRRDVAGVLAYLDGR